MNMQRFTKWLVEISVLLMAALILLAVPMLRDSNSGPIGREAYFLQRMATDLPQYDSLSYSSRVASYNIGLPYVMHVVPGKYWKFLPFAVAYLSIIAFWALLGKFRVEKRWIAVLMLASMPAYLFMAATPNRFVFPLFLILLSFLLLYSENKFIKGLGIPIIAILPLFDFVFAAIAFALLVLFALLGKHSKKHMIISALVLFVSTVAYFSYLFYLTGWPSLFNPENQFFGLNYALRAIISDFGSFAGISLFALILFVLGIVSVWNNKYSRLELFVAIALIIILSLFRIEAVMLLVLAVAVFASIGMTHLLYSEWHNKTLRWMVLVIIACGILFSAVAHAKELINGEPDSGIMNAIGFINTQEDGVVFSDYSRGNWISYAGKRNVLDQNFLFAPNSLERYMDSRTLLYTRDYPEASVIFNKYKIKYIWIDSELKNKLYSNNEEGLLFLAQYSSNITNIYNQDGVQIWKLGE